MRTLRRAVFIALLTAVTVAVGAAPALAKAHGKVTAQLDDVPGFQLQFNAGGSPAKAHGSYKWQEPSGLTASGKVDCYREEITPGGPRRAVLSGPVTKTNNPPQTNMAFLVSDETPFGTDVFRVSGNVDPDCRLADLSIFDRDATRWFVTSGDIRVG